jgi:hypothetical protein
VSSLPPNQYRVVTTVAIESRIKGLKSAPRKLGRRSEKSA